MSKKINYETVGELFCGPGGGGIGASFAKFEDEETQILIKHLWATDINKDSCETYKNNIEKYQSEHLGINEPVKVICGDVNSTEIDLNDEKQFPYVDGLLFGFPCNDFSIVGKSKGLEGQFGPLYEHGITILKRPAKPKWFIAENVSGLSSANEGKAFKQILKEMRGAGYTITAHKYKFEDYGIPQTRHRIIIVGFRQDLNLKYRVPAPPMITKTVSQALKNIPESASHQEPTKQSSVVIERLEHIKPGENAWNADIPKHLRLKVGKAKLSQIYRRLEPNKPSYTVTGSGGGGTHIYHWHEPRALTNRERARIQTFPDWHEFSGSKESIRKQIGMAIPPEGMTTITNAILSTLNKKTYKAIHPNIDDSQLSLFADI